MGSPLDRFNRDRDRIVDLVAKRCVDQRLVDAQSGGDRSLEYVLNEVAFQELGRLSGRRDRKTRAQIARWRALARSLNRMSEGQKQSQLSDLCRHYARDVVGNFDPRVYRLAAGVLPAALGLAFTPVGAKSGRGPARAPTGGGSGIDRLAHRVQVEGPVDIIRGLADIGTLVFTPTHSSNLDSVVLGFAFSQSGLPPASYGAGKNLFTNRLMAFFMRNLGAYRVDRRLKFSLYKDVLKEYSTVLLELGYHSLFFPGGTRSRSNHVEPHLKLGLLGTGLQAYINNLIAGRPDARIFVVPVTINYHLVLEAETLIADHLADEGKSRYIIEDDEFSRIGRIVEFLRKTLALEESVVIRFGQPLDPFGNSVDERGQSIDSRGRLVDPASYVRAADGSVAASRQRDMVYTRQLSREIMRAYRRDTVFLSTSLAARALYDALVESAGTSDVYRLLRLVGDDAQVSAENVCARLAAFRDRVARSPESGRVHERVATPPPEQVLEDALRALGSYHTRPVAVREGGSIRILSPGLLFYYRNRTAHVPDQLERPDRPGRPDLNESPERSREESGDGSSRANGAAPAESVVS